MNFHFFKKPVFLIASIGCAANGALVTVCMFFSPLFLEHIMDNTPKQAGLLLLAMPIAVIFFSPFVGKVIQKIGMKSTLIMTPAICLISSLLYLSLSAHSSKLLIVLTFLTVGISWGIAIVASPIAAGSTASSSQSSIAVGTVLSIWNIASVIALAVGSIIFNNIYLANEGATSNAYLAGFNAIFLFMTILTSVLLAIGIAVILSNNRTKSKIPFNPRVG